MTEEEICVNQFENLVVQKVRDFADKYVGRFQEVAPQRFPAFFTTTEWLSIFANYLHADDKEAAIRDWMDLRND